MQTAFFFPSFSIFCTLNECTPAPRDCSGVAGGGGGGTAPILGYLAEPGLGDSFRAGVGLVHGPGSVPNTWWDHLCPTICDEIWDPRSKAST